MRYLKIQAALDRGVYDHRLCELPLPPDEARIRQLIGAFPGRISSQHIELLREWGGACLDEIRIASVEKVRLEGDRVVFADDFSGYRFEYDAQGAVFAVDTDGGRLQRLAASIREFIEDVLLGREAAPFYGTEWLEELKKKGLA